MGRRPVLKPCTYIVTPSIAPELLPKAGQLYAEALVCRTYDGLRQGRLNRLTVCVLDAPEMLRCRSFPVAPIEHAPGIHQGGSQNICFFYHHLEIVGLCLNGAPHHTLKSV